MDEIPLKGLDEFLDFTLVKYGNVQLQVGDVVQVAIFLIVARGIMFLVQKYLHRLSHRGSLDKGKAYAIGQILAYFVYTITLVLALDTAGVKITVLIAGSTALFVGLGLGLQDAFRDLVSGIFLLFERTVTAGDIIEVDGLVGKVREVRLRTTLVITRDDIVMIIPNQQLTNNNVINWSQNRKPTRFAVDVGVAYGSDTKLVRDILIKVAKEDPNVVSFPEPTVQFRDFGDSSLVFKLLFYTHQLFLIEKIKSDIRFEIDRLFRENNVTIPFPQRDLWVKQWPESPIKEKDA